VNIKQLPGRITIGIISDTHGQLPAAIHEIFKGVSAILHAGDIGDETILDELRVIAPVAAVRGNMDWGDLARQLPGTDIIEVGKVRIGMVHDPYQMPANFKSGKYRIIVSGHTHQALIAKKNGVLYVNPGSAGQPRSNRPASVALLHISGTQVAAEVIPLEPSNQ
jgi:putative phosphoesterase